MRVTNNLTHNTIIDITYEKKGDYLIPNITLSEMDTREVGKWGTEHKNFLMQNDMVHFDLLLTKGELTQYLIDVNEQAKTLYDDILEKLIKQNKITEHLKEEDQMEWVRRMYSAQSTAKEFVDKRIIYVKYITPEGGDVQDDC